MIKSIKNVITYLEYKKKILELLQEKSHITKNAEKPQLL